MFITWLWNENLIKVKKSLHDELANKSSTLSIPVVQGGNILGTEPNQHHVPCTGMMGDLQNITYIT